MRNLRAQLAVAALVSAASGCTFNAAKNNGTDDARPADAAIPDAGLCPNTTEKTCAGPTLRECITMGELPMDTPCAWGCSSSPEAHCAKLQPSGGAVTETDVLDTNNLDDIPIDTLGTNVVIDTDSGGITSSNGTIRATGTDIKNGIDYQQRGSVGVFRFKKLTMSGFGTVTIQGGRALAIVGSESILLEAKLDAQGDCSGTNAGPGGFPGGGPGTKGGGGGGGGAGAGTNNNYAGGGGGGFGATGGTGGAGGGGATGGAAGPAQGDAKIASLVGGSGGGGGGGPSGVGGGGGGGAVQLVSNGTIRIGSTGGIQVGGCGGDGSPSGGDGAGGGGAGGAILIEAPIVELPSMSFLAANGGGGGGADTNVDGSNGDTSIARATAGGGTAQGGGGGLGGALQSLTGDPGRQAAKWGGGGGGSVGRIRIDTYTGQAAVSDAAVITPALGTAAASQATANVK
ncbi:MAG TPA: hypothetical protein VFQ53_00035 [Kofleriaceae bacterium]|nr:hypothetical protein [Kofleriaceae bacterium]